MNSSEKGVLVGIYSYDLEQKIYLLEMTINEMPKSVDLSLFFQEDTGLPKSEWQAPYNEQYLSSDGKTILGDFLSKEIIPGDETIVVFFMFLATLSTPLSTPYGEFSLTNVQCLPERLSRIVSYSPLD